MRSYTFPKFFCSSSSNIDDILFKISICPLVIDKNYCHICEITKLRKMPNEKRFQYILDMSESKKLNLVTKHFKCDRKSCIKNIKLLLI
ncbi:MAG: hypothetical protein PF569_04270 [Candidatus Woesearchaeota archaeon]|jgi:hypothetical protein|nr:hypothetical protein [Candidatus Woesearchaeota archaeon]